MTAQVTLVASMAGKCAKCGRSNVERAKSFTSPTYAESLRLGKQWARVPIHKRCEAIR